MFVNQTQKFTLDPLRSQLEKIENTSHLSCKFEAYFEDIPNAYRIRNENGEWIRVSESSLVRHARLNGVSNEAVYGDVSPCDRLIAEIQLKKCISYSGPLAGYPEGLYFIGGKTILVTSSPDLIPPVEGDWDMLRSILEGMLGHDPKQLICFYGWLKTALWVVYHSQNQPGQAVVFCGPRESGKSLLQTVITKIFGGREARPFQYMTGQTAFNSALFGAEHLVVEDEAASTDIRTRRHFGSLLKSITANEKDQCHPKFKEPVSLSPRRRLTISVNDEPENLMVLPLLDESLEDKIILLKVEHHPLPMPTHSPEERAAFFEKVCSEFPAFIYDMMNRQIPSEWQSPRFGVKFYHNPHIIEAIDGMSPEMRLLSLIDLTLFGSLPVELNEGEEIWEGLAADLERLLAKSEHGIEARRLLSYNSACGFYLSRLSNKMPDRVKERRVKGSRLWKIAPPRPL